nr:TolC family protein [Desulfobulbaceae bacterium]
MSYIKPIMAAILILIVLAGCSYLDPYLAAFREDRTPALPSQFTLYSEKDDSSEPWWKEFGSAELDALVAEAISGNFSVQEAWARLEQARYTAVKSGADLYPAINFASGGSYAGSHAATGSKSSTEAWSLGFSASYEVDLWGKVKADRESSLLLVQASENDVKTAILSLTGQLVENWLALISARQQETLFNQQLEIQEKLLDLIKLRFSRGKSTALDIYQQQQTIEKIKAALIPVKSSQEKINRLLALLTGKTSFYQDTLSQFAFPQLQEVPAIGLPADLIAQRPDIRSAGSKLKSSEWEVSVAKADRLPALKLTASHTYNGDELGSIFDNWLLNLAGNITGPIFDGHRRQAEVERVKAVADERLATYRKTVVTAISEVENALTEEDQYRKTVASLVNQLRLSEETMREARRRYLNGSTDFVNVLKEELNFLQLQFDTIKAREQMIAARIHLYKALGGSWLDNS